MTATREAPRAAGGPGSSNVAPAPPEAGPGRSRWSGGRIAAAVIGGVLVLISLALLGAGGTAVWADQTQRESGYVTTDVHHFSSEGSALATVSTELGSAGAGWLYGPGLLDKVRIRVTPTSPGRDVFVGIGPTTDVNRYLAGVSHTVVSEFWQDKVENVAGAKRASAPGGQGFWVASAAGPGPQSLVWNPTDGSWTVVVMNADGRPGIAVGADLGAKFPALIWIALGVIGVGAVFLAGGALLIAGAILRGR